MGNIPLSHLKFTFDHNPEEYSYLFVRKALTPNVDQPHQEDLSEEEHINNAADDETTEKEKYYQPKKISISLS